MSTINVTDLAKNSIIGTDLFNDSEGSIRDLSEDELVLQGGKRRGIRVIPVIPPFEPSDSFPLPEYIPGFYI